MLRANFFDKFFQDKQNNRHEITKYNLNEKFDLQDQIYINIKEIDRKISENSKSLLEAQIVKFRSTFSQSNNFIEKIGRNVYKGKLEQSINWHQKELKELYVRRKKLRIQLEKIQGIFWINQIKRFLIILLISFFILLSIFIFLSGFMIIIYFMPLFILLLLGYSIINKQK